MRRPTILARAGGFLGSMAGHVFLVLTVGTCAAALFSLLVAENARRRDFERVGVEHVVASTTDVVQSLDRSPREVNEMLAHNRILGAYLVAPDVPIAKPNPQLVSLLQRQLPRARALRAGEAAEGSCGDRSFWDRMAAGSVQIPLDCWIVRYVDSRGLSHSLAIELPMFKAPPSLDPTYWLVLIAASGMLSGLIARLVSAPLRQLEVSARAFSLSLDPDPLPVRGPSEVRTAIATFNLMQQRVRDSLRERTQVLAAISHDLQTPLTRLRLRLEKVQDAALRERLIADLTATQTLVREGLDLARSSESGEDWSWVDLDSLLASLAEDAREIGASVTFERGGRATVNVKPNALIRCLGNLIENAIKHGGAAEICCAFEGGRQIIAVRDEGPGVPADRLEALFEPFVREDQSRSRDRGGTGIGLTIARAQAKTFGAEVTLANRVPKGLEARVTLAARGAAQRRSAP